MFRIIVIPYANAAQTDAEVAHSALYNPRVRANGRYAYAFQTVQEARTVGMQSARNYTMGYSIYILDDELDMIVDVAKSERRPALSWKGAQTAPGQAATSKAAKRAKPAKGAKGKKA